MANTNYNVTQSNSAQATLNAAKSKPAAKIANPVAPQAQQLPQKIQAPKPSAPTAAINQTPSNLNLYSTSGTVTKPTTQKSADGFGNSDGSFTAGKNAVSITIENSDSGYNNKIYYSTDNFVTKTYLGIDNQTGTVNIGTFKEGTKIDFGIDNGQGNFFRTGSASNNADNFKHASSLTSTDGGYKVGFEDLYGGGDRDFNDAIITVRNIPEKQKEGSVNNNRSGLGDGTNPGQGAGKANSPNTGTLNPSDTKSTTSQTTRTEPAAPPPPPKIVKAPLASGNAPPINAPIPAPVASKIANDKVKQVATERASELVKSTVQRAATTKAQTSTPPVAAKVANETNNRSGLADGTNPGQGAGRVNSPNTGTLNPSTTQSATANKATTPTVKEADPMNDKKIAQALQSYQVPDAKKFTTNIQI